MNEKDRLTRLLARGFEYAKNQIDNDEIMFAHWDIANYLLENGVIVPPCLVGERTFLLLEKFAGGFDILESKCVKVEHCGYGWIYSMYIDCKEINNTLEFGIDKFGKEVFLSKEEAEKVLEEIEQYECKKM